MRYVTIGIISFLLSPYLIHCTYLTLLLIRIYWELFFPTMDSLIHTCIILFPSFLSHLGLDQWLPRWHSSSTWPLSSALSSLGKSLLLSPLHTLTFPLISLNPSNNRQRVYSSPSSHNVLYSPATTPPHFHLTVSIFISSSFVVKSRRPLLRTLL